VQVKMSYFHVMRRAWSVSELIDVVVYVQLPTCLCIHIQRTSWLDSGLALKRCDHVGFTEVLDMAPYVYCKRGAAKQRPKTLDVDPTTRLVGGRTDVGGSRLSSPTYVRLVARLFTQASCHCFQFASCCRDRLVTPGCVSYTLVFIHTFLICLYSS